MFRSPRSRAVVLVVLVALLVGLLVWHGTLGPDPAAGALPGQEEIATDGGRYIGERVSVGGPVVETDPVVIEAGYGVDETIWLRVTGLDPGVSVHAGSTLRVYGVYEGDGRVRALNAVAVPPWGRWYTWSISFLAGLWVLGRIVRRFRFDREAVGLVPRERPLGLRSVAPKLRSFLGGGDGA